MNREMIWKNVKWQWNLEKKIEEQELLLEFLLLIQQRKKGVADNLQHSVSFLCSDIEEATKQQMVFKEVVEREDSAGLVTIKRIRSETYARDTQECNDDIDDGQNNYGDVFSNKSRLRKNFKKLESAYFLTRCKSLRKPTVTGRIPRKNSFLEGLCKYLSFSKLEVKADLKQGDLLQSSNLVCALSFDREEAFFATAGVSKNIKVFYYDSIINEDCDISYPVVEMPSRSKFSSICWNTSIKSQIASSNFEGVVRVGWSRLVLIHLLFLLQCWYLTYHLVQLWDVTRSQPLSEMVENERRVWPIDFSSADPTMLASGSDDGSVKLWSINQGISVGTIKTKANVCSVQFSPYSGRFLAFGSADHRIYYYDLRNLKIPLYAFFGHDKTVSYIKLVDSVNLVSASTDNTLMLWDFSACTSQVIDTPLHSQVTGM